MDNALSKIIYQNRIKAFVLLVCIDLFINIAFPFFETTKHYVNWNAHFIIDLLIIGFGFFILIKESKQESLNNYLAKLYDNSPFGYIFINAKNKQISISQNIVNMMGLVAQKNYDVEDFRRYFSSETLSEFERVLYNEHVFGNIEQNGNINFDKDASEISLKYHIRYLYNDHNVSGLIIWISDTTVSSLYEKHIIHLIKRYRDLSFDLDYMINNLPFPMWMRNTKGDIIFANTCLNELRESGDNRDLEQLLIENFKKSMKQGSISTFKKQITSNGKTLQYEFYEIPLASIVGSIGYAIDKSRFSKIEYNFEVLNVIFNRITELTNRGFLLIDNAGVLKTYNKKFLELFDIDIAYLESKPTFASILDRMKTDKMIPEVRDFKEYKTQKLKLLREISNPYSEIVHLGSGRSYSVLYIPIPDRSVLLTYDDISESLDFERKLNEYNAVQNSIVDAFNIPIMIVTQSGFVKKINEECRKRFNLDERSDIENDFKELALNIIGVDSEGLVDKVIQSLEKRVDGNFQDVQNRLNWVITALPDSTVLLVGSTFIK